MTSAVVAAGANAASKAMDRADLGLYRFMQDYDNPRMSMTFSHSKGLLNAPGQNNCFLNSAVQVLWHLDVFRRNFRHLSGHMCMGHSCIFCALKVIFTQFQHSDKGAQPPDPLRRALAHTFANQQRFQLGYMDDAAECFENILLRIHTHVAPDEKEDQCRARHCITHQKFSLAITEQVGCTCGATSDPFSYNEMVFYVSTSALVDEAMNAYKLNTGSWGNFARLLKDTVAKGDMRSCPRNCGVRCEKKRMLTNSPDVVSIGLVWDSAKSGAEHIQDVVGCIGTSLCLRELFHSATTCDAVKNGTVLNLVGVVCYYGKHYSTFFFHSKVEEWIYFDDAAVKQISRNWEDVVDRIVRGRHQPLLLLYMNPRSHLLSVETALQATAMVPGYEWKEADADVTSSGLMLESAGVHANSSSLPPPPPGFDGSDSSSSTSSAAPASVCNGNRQLLQVRSCRLSDSAKRMEQSKAAAAAWALAHPYTAYNARQQDDRDSGADEGSGTDLDRQSSLISTDDTASSYSSRASCSSNSYMGDRERGYCIASPACPNDSAAKSFLTSGLVEKPVPVPEKQTDKVRMRKKKMRYGGAGMHGISPASRCLSAVSLTSVESGDSASKAPMQDVRPDGFTSSSDPPGYATLPRKKKARSAAAVDDLSRHVDWIKEVAKKGEQLQQTAVIESQDVKDRIKQFNGLCSAAAADAGQGGATGQGAGTCVLGIQKTSAAPKASLYGSSCGETEPVASVTDVGYINRNSVERLIRQQKTGTASPVKTYGATAAITDDMAALRLTVGRDAPGAAKAAATAPWLSQHAGASANTAAADAVSISSLKDSGYRSGAGGDRTSTSSVGSFFAESPTLREGQSGGGHAFQFGQQCTMQHELKEDGGRRTSGCSARDLSDDDEDFPPPPSEQELRRIGGGWHAKQASQGSLSSETSTLRNSSTAQHGDSSDESVCGSTGCSRLAAEQPASLALVAQLPSALATASGCFRAPAMAGNEALQLHGSHAMVSRQLSLAHGQSMGPVSAAQVSPQSYRPAKAEITRAVPTAGNERATSQACWGSMHNTSIIMGGAQRFINIAEQQHIAEMSDKQQVLQHRPSAYPEGLSAAVTSKEIVVANVPTVPSAAAHSIPDKQSHTSAFVLNQQQCPARAAVPLAVSCTAIDGAGGASLPTLTDLPVQPSLCSAPPLYGPHTGAARSLEQTVAASGGVGAHQPPLYGERQPLSSSIASSGSRQRDSYALSLGSTAADLYSRGVILPPKSRSSRESAGAAVRCPSAASVSQQLQNPQQHATPPVMHGRTAYELGFSHYDRLPQSQSRCVPLQGVAAVACGANTPANATRLLVSSAPAAGSAASRQQETHRPQSGHLGDVARQHQHMQQVPASAGLQDSAQPGAAVLAVHPYSHPSPSTIQSYEPSPMTAQWRQPLSMAHQPHGLAVSGNRQELLAAQADAPAYAGKGSEQQPLPHPSRQYQQTTQPLRSATAGHPQSSSQSWPAASTGCPAAAPPPIMQPASELPSYPLPRSPVTVQSQQSGACLPPWLRNQQPPCGKPPQTASLGSGLRPSGIPPAAAAAVSRSGTARSCSQHWDGL